jgi:hypothetical protein
MDMRSFTRREKKIWLMTLFPGSMRKKGTSFPSPSFYEIGSKMFAKNGYSTPKFLSWSNNCNTILKLLQGTLGTMKSFATRVFAQGKTQGSTL